MVMHDAPCTLYWEARTCHSHGDPCTASPRTRSGLWAVVPAVGALDDAVAPGVAVVAAAGQEGLAASEKEGSSSTWRRC